MRSHNKSSPFNFLFYGRGYLVLTFFGAYFLNAIPWGWSSGIPDFVALTLLFWSFTRPNRISLWWVFCLGLLTDVQSSVILGQNIIIYLLYTYSAAILSKRIEWINLSSQIFYIFLLALLGQVITFGFYAMVGQAPSDGWFFLSCLTTALLWPLWYGALSARRLSMS